MSDVELARVFFQCQLERNEAFNSVQDRQQSAESCAKQKLLCDTSKYFLERIQWEMLRFDLVERNQIELFSPKDYVAKAVIPLIKDYSFLV